MPNDQMPNYTVQTQYVSIRPTSQKCKQRDKNRVEQRRDEKKREEKREEKEEKSIKQKIQKEEKIDCVKERAYILQTFYQKNMFKKTLNFKINFIVKLYEFFFNQSSQLFSVHFF